MAKVLACLKQMDFILEGSPEDLIRSVVPAAVEVDRLSLNDAIKVLTSGSASPAHGSAQGVVLSVCVCVFLPSSWERGSMRCV